MGARLLRSVQELSLARRGARDHHCTGDQRANEPQLRARSRQPQSNGGARPTAPPDAAEGVDIAPSPSAKSLRQKEPNGSREDACIRRITPSPTQIASPTSWPAPARASPTPSSTPAPIRPPSSSAPSASPPATS